MAPATADDLQRRFGIAGLASFAAGRGGLTCLRLTPDAAEAEVYLHGGHVTHFQPRGGAPVLFLSAESSFGPTAAIRGGIPVIFPWFGAPRRRSEGPGPRLRPHRRVGGRVDRARGRRGDRGATPGPRRGLAGDLAPPVRAPRADRRRPGPGRGARGREHRPRPVRLRGGAPHLPRDRRHRRGERGRARGDDLHRQDGRHGAQGGGRRATPAHRRDRFRLPRHARRMRARRSRPAAAASSSRRRARPRPSSGTRGPTRPGR